MRFTGYEGLECKWLLSENATPLMAFDQFQLRLFESNALGQGRGRSPPGLRVREIERSGFESLVQSRRAAKVLYARWNDAYAELARYG